MSQRGLSMTTGTYTDPIHMDINNASVHGQRLEMQHIGALKAIAICLLGG